MSGADEFPADPALAYEWFTDLSRTDKPEPAYALGRVLLDPVARKKIVEDPDYKKNTIPSFDLEQHAKCMGASSMARAAAMGHEAALRWNYDAELLHLKKSLGALVDKILTGQRQDRTDIEEAIGPDWMVLDAVDAIDAVVYTMSLEGYDLPEEARPLLKAILNSDWRNDLHLYFRRDVPPRFSMGQSVAAMFIYWP